MPDPRFFNNHGPFTLQELAALSGATPGQNADLGFEVRDVAPLDQAEDHDLSFLDNIKYKEQFANSRAGVCIASPSMASLAPPHMNLLLSDSPYRSYALAAQAFYPEAMPAAQDISPHAHIEENVTIGEKVRIEVGAVIKSGAEIGDHCWIEAGAVIDKNVKVGDHCRIGAQATISHAIIADHVRIYTGVRIGQDGFGFAIDPQGYKKVPQLGRVIIEQGVEIGANTTIDRGAGPDTMIGEGTWIDNLVQIGHNVKIGKGCIIVAQVGISGSSVVDDYAAIGGQVGIAGHLMIGKGARIAGQSGIMRDIPAGSEYMGSPAIPIKQFMRQVAVLKRLIQKEKTS